MMTLRQLAEKTESIPMSTVWYLSDLAEARGKQELFTKQSPQKLKVLREHAKLLRRQLKVLREHALIESAVSSNRIEGVNIEQDRVKPVLLGRGQLRDREEEEVRGYRDALKLIHEQHTKLFVSEKT